MAGAPRGPCQDPPASRSPNLKSMDRNMRQNLQTRTPAAVPFAAPIPSSCEAITFCRSANLAEVKSSSLPPVLRLEFREIWAAAGIVCDWARARNGVDSLGATRFALDPMVWS
jgi:hypothetical protein